MLFNPRTCRHGPYRGPADDISQGLLSLQQGIGLPVRQALQRDKASLHVPMGKQT